MMDLALVASLAGALTSGALAGTVLLTDGAMHSGAVSLDRGVFVRGTPSVKVALNTVLFARFGDVPAAEYPRGVVLTNGARIAGAFTSLTESVVQIPAKGLRLPAAEVAWAIYHPFEAALAAEVPAGKTGALLSGGDFFEGSVKSVEASTAKVLNPIFGPRVFAGDAKDFHAIILRRPVPEVAAYEVIARDGSRYPALDAIFPEPGAVTLRHPLYNGLRIPSAEIVEIRAAPSRMLVLGEMKPARAGESFATSAPGGSALRLAQQEALGCSLAGGDSATWRRTLRGGTFIARTAVATGGGGASVGKIVFVVEADGRPLFRSAPAGPEDPPALIRCAVPAAESITLRVEGAPGTQGIWADPVVLLR